MVTKFMNKPVRKRNRLKDYDYSTNGYYFVTICSKDKNKTFGSISNPEQNYTKYSKLGFIIEKHILNIEKHYDDVRINKYVIMPNHVHMIVVIGCNDNNRVEKHSLSIIVGQFKAGVTKEARATVWQRNFHDHIIRTQEDYERIWRYIDANPALWYKDCFFD